MAIHWDTIHQRMQMGHDVWGAIKRRYQEQANAEINAAVDRLLEEPWLPVPHDTYHRILHRLRQQHAEAVMQETLDILRGVPAVDATHAEWQRKQAWMDAQDRQGDDPLSIPSLQARVDACPPITCGVVGHAPDCECATL